MAGGDAQAPIISMVTSDAYEHQLAERLHKTLGAGDNIDKLTKSVNDMCGDTVSSAAVIQNEQNMIPKSFPHYEESDYGSESGYDSARSESEYSDSSDDTYVTSPITGRRSASQLVQTEEKKSEKSTQVETKADPVPTQTPEPEPIPTQTPEPDPIPTQTPEPDPIPEPTRGTRSHYQSQHAGARSYTRVA